MLSALAVVAVTLPASTYGVYRFEAWSKRREELAAARRDAAAPFVAHPGADDAFAAVLRAWRDAGQGSAVAR